MNNNLYRELSKLEKNNWWCVGRQKVILDLLKRHLPEKNVASSLDVGCGTGAFIEPLKDLGEAAGIDISPEAIKFCKKRGLTNVNLGDATSLPYPDNRFDLVTALDVLEHIQDDQKAINEIYRVLKRGGMTLITAPAFNFLWSSHDKTHDHKRRYTDADLEMKIKKANFNIKRVTYINSFLLPCTYFYRKTTNLLNRLGVYKGHSDLYGLPKPFNFLLLKIFNSEALFLRYVNFPIGVTVLIIAEKGKVNV